MRLVGIWVFVLGLSGMASADALDKPAFTATPAELLAAAKATTPGDAGAVVLREDVDVSYDERGRATTRVRLVFTVSNAAAVDNWGTLGLGWQPFYQARPVIRARVIAPDGAVAELDASLISDAPAVSESPAVFSDRRDMTVPLPRLTVGAVVEEEWTTVDAEPLLAAGTVDWTGVERSVVIDRKVVTISAPTARKPTIVARGFTKAPKPRTRTAGDRTVVSYTFDHVVPTERDAYAPPNDHVSSGYIGVATGASWAAIAADYRQLVEAKLGTGLALPSELAGPPTRATVDKIVAWLHSHVRYTGIELSDSAIIPFAPAETLARGFGDCKDKATLLVALLRAAGVRADVALLQTGPGWDVDVALPGMGNFDHAIVRAIVDGKELWIDATEDLLPAGQLPTRDQGRRALIASAGTRGLTVTPMGTARDNWIAEVRTYQLAERGTSKLTEVSTQGGVYLDDLRGFLRNTARTDVDKQLRTYVDSEYGGKVTAIASTDVADLATPFSLTLEVGEIARVSSLREVIEVTLSRYDVLDRVPAAFTSTDADWAQQATERTIDYVWIRPHHYQIENRLIVPSGYTPPPLPASETRALGAMTLTTTRTRTGDTYVVTYRLDTGKLRLTAAEFRATRAAVIELGEEDRDRITIVLDGAKLIGAGKLREAIAEYQRLIALHPKEALHHGQLAQAYLEAGMYEAARRAARRGTELEPGAGDAWMILGHVLRRDASTRIDTGVDRTAAIAAYRKAIALSPHHIGARADLAEMLSTENDGSPTLDVARLREAAALWMQLRDSEGTIHDDQIVSTLAAAGDAQPLEKFAQGLGRSPTKDAALVFAAALRGGAPAAVTVADRLPRGDRETALQRATEVAFLARRYPLATALRATTSLASAPAWRMLDRARMVDLRTLPPADPTTPVKLAFAFAVGADIPAGAISAGVRKKLLLDLASVVATLRTMPVAVRADMMASMMELVTTGDAKRGWRVVADGGTSRLVLYVVMRRGRAVLLGGPDVLDPLGSELVAAIKGKDLALARRLLVQVDEDLDATTAKADLRGFLTRHRAELATGSVALLELAAAMMMARETDPAWVAASAGRCAGLTGAQDREACARLAVEAAVETSDWTTAVVHARALLAAARTDPNRLDPKHGWLLAQLLELAGQHAEAVKQVDANLADAPRDVDLIGLRVSLLSRASWRDGRAALDAAVADPTVTPSLNNMAWLALFHEPTPALALTLAERALATSATPSRQLRNTYAAALAEANRPYEAWQQLSADLEPELRSADWYVLGRIAEDYGLRDDAIAMYRRVTGPVLADVVPSSEDFARRRLTALGVK